MFYKGAIDFWERLKKKCVYKPFILPFMVPLLISIVYSVAAAIMEKYGMGRFLLVLLLYLFQTLAFFLPVLLIFHKLFQYKKIIILVKSAFVVIFFGMCAMLLLELLVMLYSGFHMNFASLHFLFNPETYRTIEASHLIVLYIAGILLFGYSMASCLWFGNYPGKIGRRFFLGSILSCFLIVCCSAFLSDTLFVRGCNILSKIVMYPVREAVADHKKIDSTKIRKYIDTKSEKAIFLDNNYPYYRITKGFRGDKAFDFEPKLEQQHHVIFVFMESFRGVNIGKIFGHSHSLSPRFDQLADDGIFFTNFYSNGVHTSRAVISSLFGILSLARPESVQANYTLYNLWGIPQIFKSRNYVTSYIHGGSLDFEKKTLFFGHNGIDFIVGKEILKKLHPGCVPTYWGVKDDITCNFALNRLMKLDKSGRNSFSIIFSVTNHFPFQLSNETYLPGSELSNRFISTMEYSDGCLGKLVDALKKLKLYDKCILFILGDHGWPLGEHHREGYSKNIYEESVRIPLLILAPGRIKKPKVINGVCSQIDLLPTVIDMFGFKDVVNHGMGKSLLRMPREGYSAYFSSPYGLFQLGIRKGHFKYIYNKANNTDELYDLSRDIGERKNIISEHPEFTAKYKNVLLDIFENNNQIIINNKLIPSK